MKSEEITSKESESTKKIEVLKGQHFQFKNDDVVILKRKNGLQEKPPLYLFNLSRMTYISSLKEIEENLYKFDVRKGPKGIEVYTLKYDKGKFEIEKIG